jgi:hypothetical protein
VLDRRYQPGDRVRSRVLTDGVKVGTPGTVQLQLTAVRDLYQVLFDGQLHSLLMRSHELEHETEAMASRRSTLEP